MTDVSSLAASSGFWEVVDEISFIAVIVGVVGEGLSEWPPRALKSWPHIAKLGRISWLILVAGLAGEFGAQHIKSASDALILESLRSDNLLLERQLQPRRLNAGEQKMLEGVTAKFPGKVISVWSYGLDIEGTALAGQIVESLGSTNPFVVNRIGAMLTSQTARIGIRLTGPDDGLIAALLEGLRELSPVKDAYNPQPPRAVADVEIFVGIKPLLPTK